MIVYRLSVGPAAQITVQPVSPRKKHSPASELRGGGRGMQVRGALRACKRLLACKRPAEFVGFVQCKAYNSRNITEICSER